MGLRTESVANCMYGWSVTSIAAHGDYYPDSKVHVANMGPTWVLSVPGWSHVGPMNFAIKVCLCQSRDTYVISISFRIVIKHYTYMCAFLGIDAVLPYLSYLGRPYSSKFLDIYGQPLVYNEQFYGAIIDRIYNQNTRRKFQLSNR